MIGISALALSFFALSDPDITSICRGKLRHNAVLVHILTSLLIALASVYS